MSTSTRSGSRFRGRLAVAGAAAVALLLSACGSSSDSSDTTTSAAATTAATSAASSATSEASAATSATSEAAGESSAAPSDLGLMTDGTLVVGMNLQFPPQMYLDGGEPAGYDVDLLNLLAEDLGVTLDIQNLDFNGLIPGLQSQKFDLVSVGLNATEERKKVIDFSRGYVPYTSVLAIKADDATAPEIDNWNKEGVVITALQGSTGEALAKSTFPNATVNGFPDQNAALLEVASGRAQGSVVEDYILAQFTKANADQLKPAAFPEPLEISYGSWGVQKGNAGLVQALDAFLCQAQNDGTLAELYKKNFGVEDFPPMPEGC